jgi:hypothetical protein
MICWAGCYQTDELNEPAGDWVYPRADGSTYPATSIPWAKKTSTTPAQPDNNGGNADQCVYGGSGNAGFNDENVIAYQNQINTIACECGEH